MAHVYIMLDTQSYKLTFRICKRVSFSTETMIARKRLKATLVYSLSCYERSKSFCSFFQIYGCLNKQFYVNMGIYIFIKYVWPNYSFADNRTPDTDFNFTKMTFNRLRCIFLMPLQNFVGFYISPQSWPCFALELSLLDQHFQQKQNFNLHLYFPWCFMFLYPHVTLHVVVVRGT